MKTPFLWLFLLTLPNTVSAQNFVHVIDSLKQELAKPIKDTTRVNIMMGLAQFYFHQQMDSSVRYAEKGLGLARKIKYSRKELYCLFGLAKTLSDRDIPRSMGLYYDVVERAQKPGIENSYLQAGSYQGIAELHFYLRNWQQCIDYRRKARQIALAVQDTAFVSLLDQDIGEAYFLAGQLDSCRYYLTKANKEWPIAHRSPINQAYTAYYWGQAESVRNPMLALRNFQRSIRIAKSLPSFRVTSLACWSLADFYLHSNKPDSAIQIARVGLQAAQQLNFYRGIYDNSSMLAEAYKRLHAIDSAYRYQTIMVVARDSVFSFDKINRTQTAIIAEQQRVQTLEDEKNRIKLYGLVALLVGLVVLAGVMYRNAHRERKANSLLQDQKEEIDRQRTKAETALTDLKATQTQLIQKEKLASLGELTAGIAHEIQNPLNFVNNFSEVSAELVEELKGGPFQQLPDSEKEYAEEILRDLTQNLQKITHHGSRASSIVKGMLEHSRTESGEKRPTDLASLADEYLKIAYHGLRAKDKNFNCELVTDFDPSLSPVEVAPQEVGRVLLNLYNNAFYAVQERTRQSSDPAYKPRVTVSSKPQGDTIEIRISDNGTGIPDSVKAKIFQPFFTTKPTGEGTGLGLSLSFDIVTKGHGGMLRVESQVGEGTTFVMELPQR